MDTSFGNYKGGLVVAVTKATAKKAAIAAQPACWQLFLALPGDKTRGGVLETAVALYDVSTMGCHLHQ